MAIIPGFENLQSFQTQKVQLQPQLRPPKPDISEFRTYMLKKNPNLTKTQLAQIDDLIVKEQTKIIASQGIPLDEIQTDPTLLGIQAQQVQSGTYKTTGKDSKAAADLRKEFSSESKNLNFKDVQSSYNKALSAASTGAGDLTVIYSYIKALDPTSVVREGEINLTKAAESVPNNIIRAYQRAKEGKVMSPELRQEMVNELAGIYNDKARKQQELNAFYGGLATSYGLDPDDVIGGIGEIKLAEIKTPAQINKNIPLSEKVGNKAGDLVNLLFGGTKNIIQDVAQAGPAGARTQASQKLLEQGKMLEQQAIQEQDPARRTQMLKEAQDIFSQASGEAASAAGGFSPSVQQNPLFRAATAAPEVPLFVQSLLGLPSLLKGGGQIIKGGLSKNAISESRKLLAQKYPNIPKEPIKQAVKQHILDDPESKKIGESILKSLNKNTSATDILRKMGIWKKAYTSSGDVRPGKEIYNTAYQAAKRLLKDKAPEVAKQTEKLRFLYELPKQAQKATWLGLKAVGLGKLLGL